MGGRRAPQAFEYEAFVPDSIANIELEVPFGTAELARQAEDAIRAIGERAGAIGLEALGPLLLRSEAMASSRIEGYQVSPLNLARALIDPRSARGSARTVAANVSAMEAAIARADDPAPLDTDDLNAIHGVLMAADPGAMPGQLRTVQNWIGGRLPNPSDAVYVPPPEDLVPKLVEDLIAFMAREDLPPVAVAAIAHAQFETIHPFMDGNGRVGRCLIHVVLRRAGVATAFVPPISIVLAARPTSYIAGLTGFREGRISAWIESFSGACVVAARHSADLASEIADLQASWRRRLGRVRSDAAASKLLDVLPAQPVVSAPTVRAAIGTSQQQALVGLKVLADAGVLRQISEGTYDRQYAATDLLDLVGRFEAGVAGRTGAA